MLPSGMSTIPQRASGEANEEALALWELFGLGTYDAVQRRVALAVDRERVDDTMFWLEVQERLYGLAEAPNR